MVSHFQKSHTLQTQIFVLPPHPMTHLMILTKTALMDKFVNKKSTALIIAMVFVGITLIVNSDIY